MTEWSVAFEAAGPTDDTALAEDQLWPLLEALSAHSPAVGGGGPRYDAQFNVTASDAGAAMTQALRIWRRAVGAAGLPPWPIVHVEILTAAEHERVLTEPQPELVGVSEIAAILGTTRNRAWQVTKKIDFPEPLAELAGGPVWALPMVTRFLEEWPRRRGPVPGVARAQVDQPRRLEAGDLDSTEPHVCPGAHPRRPGGEGTATRQGGGNPMPKKSPVHTVPHGDGWANRREGAERVSKTFGTKAEAQAAGRDTAKRDSTEHVIHKKDGSIGEKNSYGNDSYPPRG